VFSVRAARRYRWRLAGGRLIADSANLRFVPNRLERRRAGAHWECTAEDVTEVRARGRIWLAVETSGGTEMFRIFGTAAAVPSLREALHPSAHGPSTISA
jgi:hypothetical protein